MNKKFLIIQILIIIIFAGMIFDIIPRPKSEQKGLFVKPKFETFVSQSQIMDSEASSDIKLTLAFVGPLSFNQNDSADPILEKFQKDSGKFWVAKSGGDQVLNQYLKILKEKIGPSLLVFSLGGQFNFPKDSTEEIQGQNNLNYLKNFNGIQADFNANSKIAWPINIPFVASNIYDLESKSMVIEQNVQPFIVLEQNGLKILIVSLSEPEEQNIKDYPKAFYRDPVGAFTQIKQTFGKTQPNLIVVLFRGDGLCVSKKTSDYISWDNAEQTQLECNKNKGPFKFLKHFFPGQISIVALSDPYNAFGTFHQTGVIQVADRGKYLGMVDLYFDAQTKVLKKQKTLFHPFIKTCHFFHPETEDCHPTQDFSLDLKDFDFQNQDQTSATFLSEKIN